MDERRISGGGEMHNIPGGFSEIFRVYTLENLEDDADTGVGREEDFLIIGHLTKIAAGNKVKASRCGDV